MSDSIRAGDFRICPSCGSRNKAAHNYCVRCSAPMHAAVATRPVAGVARAGGTRTMRFVLASGVIAAVAVGFIVRTVFRATEEVGALSEDVRADSARTVSAPPPPVSGWYPGANVPVEPDTAPTWSSSSFPMPRANPYDVPGDPNASMVGIAPRASRVRAAMARKRIFTDDDLLETRGGSWSAPPAPVPVHPPARHDEFGFSSRHATTGAPPPDPQRNDEIAKRESKLNTALSRLDSAEERLNALRARTRGAADEDAQRSLEDAADDVDDAQRDAARATRKLEEARRRN